ncbi:hypothetical protein [Bradyrhizobium septentrionale]|uniref:Uncharacterized protein n=1 Tax=Bradyrhizobium septentrionale TaxID=1404411 RepID=A0A973VWJ9_9BRAD|nr:hypothetical protein [Bradyrhizobium septentrionale]UGY19970.1 hypothetical protein HAP48_0022350 [Bradyrhizobium septentrionale]
MLYFVMPGLVPGIYALSRLFHDSVDGQDMLRDDVRRAPALNAEGSSRREPAA